MYEINAKGKDMKKMKNCSAKILCAALGLILLAEPIPAFAYGAEETISIQAGSYGRAKLIIAESELDTTAAHINGIPYKPDTDQNGSIIVYSGDLAAAGTGSEVLQNSSGFIKADDLLITKAKLQLDEETAKGTIDPIVEMRKGYYAISGAAFTQDQISLYSQIIDEALDELSKLIDTLESDVRDELRKLFDDADAKKSFDYFTNNPKNAMWRFRIGMRDVYSFLFDMRTTLAEQAATKDVSATLNKIGESKLMQAMRTVLQETFGNTMYTDFWTDDAAWDSYSKHYVLDKELENLRNISLVVGKTFIITDGSANKTELTVERVGTMSIILDRTVTKTPYVYDPYAYVAPVAPAAPGNSGITETPAGSGDSEITETPEGPVDSGITEIPAGSGEIIAPEGMQSE